MVRVPGEGAALDGAEGDPDAVRAGHDGAHRREAVLAVRAEALGVQRVRRRLLVDQRRPHRHILINGIDSSHLLRVQPADIGLPTGNGKKLSRSQAQLGQATCLAVD